MDAAANVTSKCEESLYAKKVTTSRRHKDGRRHLSHCRAARTLRASPKEEFIMKKPFAVQFVKSVSDKSLETVAGGSGITTYAISINPKTGKVIDHS
jgi:hypothetical protein